MKSRSVVTWATIGAAAALAIAPLALAPSAGAAAGDVQRIVFRTTVTPDSTDLHQLPGERQFGSLHFTGTTTLAGEPATVEARSLIEYRQGEGPWSGYLIVRTEDGSELAVSISADTTRAAAGPRSGTSIFTGKVRVLGGSGDFRGASGAGTLTGQRAAELGTPITLRLVVELKR